MGQAHIGLLGSKKNITYAKCEISKFLNPEGVVIIPANDPFLEKTLKVLSHVEAKIDFPDEDLPNNILDEIKSSSNEVVIKIKKILNDHKVGERIREGFKIAILGPTNAGKSSLMNHLSNRDVAIVSENCRYN